MNKKSFLKKINENLKISTKELNNRWEKIFLEYLRRLHQDGPQTAEEYLALHLGELDSEFQLFFFYYADLLKEKGLSEAAKRMKRIGENFSSKFKNYRIKRSSDIAQNAKKVAEKIKNYQK